MSDIIHLLPDSIANQIAAGEVIQRPASVVKELVENAVDAGATLVQVVIKDAGKTLIQVIDNGKGMSETDARMSFERHATSKITKADDLFCIRTMGFRGEALASIAAVAHVELRTKQKDSELGTFLYISGTEVIKQNSVSCQDGSNFSVFNLFFNIPARRKFLKTNNTELRHIITEFQRISLANPEVAFTLHHNNAEIFSLPESNLKQRIVNLFGKNMNQSLTPISVETGICKINGFIGKPEYAKKSNEEQFFYVNNRYIKQQYFHKAIMLAYEQILPAEAAPAYFIYFDIDPKYIDVNIHPTKTEINFEDAGSIFQILRAAVKEALGKFNIVPSIDFDQDGAVAMPPLKKGTEIKYPMININSGYNPFDQEHKNKTQIDAPEEKSNQKDNVVNWQKLYSAVQNSAEIQQNKKSQQTITETQTNDKVFQFKGKYILTPVKSGLMMINQKRAHERILYEVLMNSIKNDTSDIQQLLYPETMELNPTDYSLMTEIMNDIRKAGFDIQLIGKNAIVINGIPAQLGETAAKELVESILNNFKNSNFDVKQDNKEKIAKSIALASAIDYGKPLNGEEMREIIDNLFACQTPNFSPDGKKVLTIVTNEEIDKKFS